MCNSFRNGSSRALCAVIGAAVLLAGCSGPQPKSLASADEPVAMSAVAGAARALYDEHADGSALARDVTDVFAALGIPVLTDAQAISAKRQSGALFAIDAEVAAIADGLERGALVGLDAFVADLAAKGLQTKDPAAPLTRGALTAALAPLAAKENLSRTELLPALVIALGQERARRSAAPHPDPVWGDDRLDPLQHALLYAAIRTLADHPSGSARSTRSAQLDGLGKAGEDVAVEVVLDFIGRYVGWPIGAAQNLSQAVCAPIYLWGHKLKLELSPDEVYMREPDGPGRPYQSHAQALLVFDLKPYDDAIRSKIREAAGCGELPEPGPVPGKKIEWTIDEELEPRGSLVDVTTTTGPDGTARATYEADLERVPAPFRASTNQKHVTGTVKASASGILPEFPLLELFEKSANDLLNGYGVLVVNFYQMPVLYLHFDSTVTGTNVLEKGDSLVMHWKSVIALPPSEKPGAEPPLYSAGAAPFSYHVDYTHGGLICSSLTSFVSFSPIEGRGNMEAAIVPAGLVETMPLHFKPGLVSETYDVGVLVNGQCTAQPAFFQVSIPISTWGAMHGSDLSGFALGDRFYLYQFSGWTSPGPGMLRIEFNGSSIRDWSESTTLVLSMDP
jgi:hypothetical protein